MKSGVYSDKDIIELIRNGNVKSSTEITEKQIQPSSMDLRVGKTLYHLRFSTIPEGNVTEFLEKNASYKVDLNQSGFLHKGNIYLAELDESLDLPQNVFAKANPKSSTGRIDVHVRLITENGKFFDEVPRGYKGKLFLEIYPISFDLILKPGFSFNQIRFFEDGTNKLDNSMLRFVNRTEHLLLNEEVEKAESENFIQDNSVYVTLDLGEEIRGYVTRPDAPPIDLSRRDLPLSKYFDKVNPVNGGIIIQKDLFYLLKSKEIVNIPNYMCAEMADISTKAGEFRAHYAGFFDPGFNSFAVLEVRNSGAPIFLRHGQKIGSFYYYELKSQPSRIYGQEIGSNYQGQKGIRAAKFFDLSK